MMKWLHPKGLATRIIGLTLLALLVSQAVGYFSFRHSSEDLVERMVGHYMGQTIAALDSSLHYVKPEYRGRMVQTFSHRRTQYFLRAEPPDCPKNEDAEQVYSKDLAARLGVEKDRVRVCIESGLRDRSHAHAHGWGKTIAVSLLRTDGQWLTVQRSFPARSMYWAWHSLRNLVITLVIMAVLVVLTSYWFTRPLRDLARAAERFGRGQKIEPVQVRGSDEIKRSIIEFNHMQERINRFMAERVRLVAALAHDLRSPITALRLRLELMPEDDNTRAMNATLSDMFHMSEAALTFMREEASTEQARRVDLTALVDAVCEDYRAGHAAVAFTPGPSIEVSCRPVAVRRALRNVIDNALLYGKNVVVQLSNGEASVTIAVLDDGPGILEADLDTVFDAFVRLETSRSRETGGVGLGLTIARSIIHGHGGEITLKNRAEGGLSVQMSLPRVRRV